MDIKSFTAAQFQKYYEARLKAQKLRKSGSGYSCKCPFHDDRTASFSLNFSKGVWRCHASCGGGGVLDFEKRFSGCDDAQAMANIADIVGVQQSQFSGPKWEAKYDYTDEYGKLLFQVIRYAKDKVTGKKRISQRRPLENGDWEWNTDKCRRVLYRLPEILTATEILIHEGEKKADIVRDELPEGVASTCSPGGAGKWRDEYAVYFAGKKVIIFPDNDEAGKKHALQIAHSVYKHAAGVKIVELPGLPEKGDMVDYYEAGHCFIDVVAEVNKVQPWKPPEVERGIFVDIVEFTKASPKEIDWLIEGVIQKGANGIMTARPKAGKSLCIADMCVALAAGQQWAPGQTAGLPGFYIERPVKVALVSREDAPGLTQWRMMKIAAARQVSLEEIRENLFVNSKEQTPQQPPLGISQVRVRPAFFGDCFST